MPDAYADSERASTLASTLRAGTGWSAVDSKLIASTGPPSPEPLVSPVETSGI